MNTKCNRNYSPTISETTKAKHKAAIYVKEIATGLFVIEKNRNEALVDELLTAADVANLYNRSRNVAVESGGNVRANFAY